MRAYACVCGNKKSKNETWIKVIHGDMKISVDDVDTALVNAILFIVQAFMNAGYIYEAVLVARRIMFS